MAYHRLFVDKKNDNGETSKLYSLYLGGFDGKDREIFKICHDLRKASYCDTLIMRINSSGGYIDQMHMIINLCNDIFKDRVTTIIDNEAESAAATIFLCGYKRVVYPRSQIMFHNYSAKPESHGQGLESYIKTNQAINKAFMKKHLGPFFKKNEIKMILNGKEYWLKTREMCKRKIATHVMIDGQEITAKKFIKK